MAAASRVIGVAVSLLILGALNNAALAQEGISSATSDSAIAAGAPVLAQSNQSASQCVNGYRAIPGVRSRGRTQGGVIIKCRG